MPATLSRRIRAYCPRCRVVHFLRPLDVGRPLECDACGTDFVVHRACARTPGPMNLRSRSMEDMNVGSGRPSGSELRSVSAGALLLLVILVLIVLLTLVDWTAFADGLRAILK